MKELLSSKKGSLTLKDAPQIVMIVGFIFFIMATIAFVSEEYREGMGAEKFGSVTNESIPAVNGTTYSVDSITDCNFESFAVSGISNESIAFNAGNYTVNAALGTIVGSAARTANYTNSVTVNYTFKYGGTACDVTEDLESELGDNTSIAGIVLTISLVGIVLSVLVGIFVNYRRKEI